MIFARAAGCELTLDRWPELGRGLVLGPLVPSRFRLEGPDALPGAAETFARDAAAFGAITSNDMTPRERMYWERVRRSQYAQGFAAGNG